MIPIARRVGGARATTILSGSARVRQVNRAPVGRLGGDAPRFAADHQLSAPFTQSTQHSTPPLSELPLVTHIDSSKLFEPAEHVQGEGRELQRLLPNRFKGAQFAAGVMPMVPQPKMSFAWMLVG